MPSSKNRLYSSSGQSFNIAAGSTIALNCTYLEETTDILFNHIKSSNFSSQIHESFLDLGVSTGAVIVEAGDGIQSSLNFRSVSLSEVMLEQTSSGICDTIFREFKVPVSDIPVAENKEGRLILNLEQAEKLNVVFAPSMLRNAEILGSEEGN